MKVFAKFVTGMLVALLAATPVFAAVPCRPAVQSKACCGGAECPMTAKAKNSKATGNKETKNVPGPCCKVTPHFLAAVTPQRPPESQLSLAVRHESFKVFFLSAVQGWEKVPSPIHFGSPQRWQAALCTFLI